MLPEKPYLLIPIQECGEPLVDIPSPLVCYDPHPYVALGAGPFYNGQNPWRLRASVVEALLQAQKELTSRRPGWKIKIFDAWRPNAVQEFMVERTFQQEAKKAGFDPQNLDQKARDLLTPRVFNLFAFPSEDPRTPPPHSTGGAVDCTLVDALGVEVDMGGPIDDLSPAAHPDFFTQGPAMENRGLLLAILHAQDFRRAPQEWWHFSLGDQMWALAKRRDNPSCSACARFGSIT